MMPRDERNLQYEQIHADAIRADILTEVCRELCKKDIFYLLTIVMERRDVNRDWLYLRCMDVQDDCDEKLDLWAREHYKSTIITFAKTIQDILVNPNITACIFSHTKPIAKAFLRQIKYELETNTRLQFLFPEIFWEHPKKEAQAAGVQWSEEKGITVRRSSNPKESTLEASGLVDGQPTSKHYALLIYDDIVTLDSVTSPEMMKKTTDALALSYNLGADGGARRFIGTRYHYNDTYATLLERGTVEPRIHPATNTGQVAGEPVFLDKETLRKKRRDMGPYIYACQMLQNPKADSVQGFKEEWLKRYTELPPESSTNYYILVDPAGEKRKMNDYTSMWVIGASIDQNYYLVDGVRDRLNLTERASALFHLHRKWQPIGVGYEKYSMQSDIAHIEYEQDIKAYHFPITPLGGQTPKNDRIRKLVPVFEQGRMWFPKFMNYTTVEGGVVELIDLFVKNEFKAFPVSSHDDMLDCMARVEDKDLKVFFPVSYTNANKPRVLREIA